MSQQVQTSVDGRPVVVPESRLTPVPPVAEEPSTRGAGWVFFAAVMMIVMGCFDAIQGLSAIIKSGFYVVPPDYFISVNATGWGWTHLILGAVVVLAGLALFSGSMWARVIGIVVAGLSMIANFAAIPLYPFWALSIIFIDALVIWALAAHGRALAPR
jgi:hypothetical protein